MVLVNSEPPSPHFNIFPFCFSGVLSSLKPCIEALEWIPSSLCLSFIRESSYAFLRVSIDNLPSLFDSWKFFSYSVHMGELLALGFLEGISSCLSC